MAMIRRLYRCSDCGFQFEEWQDKRDALLADCPNVECASNAVDLDAAREQAENAERFQRMVESGIPPAMSTNKSIALKHAERAMDAMGMSDFNDSGRQGERAAKAPAPPGTAEIEAMTREAVEAKAITQQEASQFAEGAKTFWQGGQKAPAGAPRPPKLQQHINSAGGAAAVARNMGADPIKLLHDGEKKTGGLRNEVVAAVRG